jgi:hypothetical protein
MPTEPEVAELAEPPKGKGYLLKSGFVRNIRSTGEVPLKITGKPVDRISEDTS